MKTEKIELKDYHPPLDYGAVFKFDKYDARILAALDENARSPLSELSKKVGLSRDAVRKRIEKLVESNVILSIAPIYNPPKMGFPIINYVFIALWNPNEKEEKEFVLFLKNHKHVTYVAGLIGKWDFILDIMAQNQGEFDKVLKEIRHTFHDLVKDYEVYGVLQEYKYEDIGGLVYKS